MAVKPKKVEPLTAEEEEYWNVLQSELINGKGSICISQSNFTKLCQENSLNCSTATARRKLLRMQEVGLISMEREGKGNNPYKINWLGYGDYNKLEASKEVTPLTGTVPLDSPLYLKRDADEVCMQKLKAGASREGSRPFIRIRAPKQMGKSSLLRRIQYFLERQLNHVVGFVDLASDEDFYPDVFNDLDRLLYQFTSAIAKSFSEALKTRGVNALKDLPDIQEYWQNNLTPQLKCANYLNDNIFLPIKQSKTLIIDGIDEILGKPTQDPFLKFLRSWNEKRMKVVSQAPIVWPSVVIAYSTEPYSILGIRGSVLQNVGTVVELKEFSKNQIQELSTKYELTQPLSESEVDFLMKLTGGHPALINQSLYQISQGMTLTQLEHKAIQPDGPFWDDLSRAREVLENNDNLSRCFHKILKGEICNDDLAKFQLAKAGLIKIEDDGVNAIALYQRYFQEHH
ncbi:AAA-like domain-containing protein [Microcoleus sp. FACHB-831]|uniref:AAA-like domain-containing protein n=1 Tax=Microcoleus sp. FACHB-831 TaxID=2692827 RepID=UPI00168A3777|nr:AAA-like domain-containing protein [Microcoleus sp. FACHB-831]MBD1922728.1 AAA-like domain-containing protein [Microcoleus sp. FACHB-831]